MAAPPDVTNWLKEPHPSTKDFVFQQTMLRVKNIEKSLDFYTGILGMRLLTKFDFHEYKFSLYFLGYEDPQNIPKDTDENIRWMFKRPACIELTYNWGDDKKEDLKYGCKAGEGFGHIGICVPDVYDVCKRFEELGVEFTKKPDGGSMKGLAFILDPDGYKIEILNNDASVQICQPGAHPVKAKGRKP